MSNGCDSRDVVNCYSTTRSALDRAARIRAHAFGYPANATNLARALEVQRHLRRISEDLRFAREAYDRASAVLREAHDDLSLPADILPTACERIDFEDAHHAALLLSNDVYKVADGGDEFHTLWPARGVKPEFLIGIFESVQSAIAKCPLPYEILVEVMDLEMSQFCRSMASFDEVLLWRPKPALNNIPTGSLYLGGGRFGNEASVEELISGVDRSMAILSNYEASITNTQGGWQQIHTSLQEALVPIVELAPHIPDVPIPAMNLLVVDPFPEGVHEIVNAARRELVSIRALALQERRRATKLQSLQSQIIAAINGDVASASDDEVNCGGGPNLSMVGAVHRLHRATSNDDLELLGTEPPQEDGSTANGTVPAEEEGQPPTENREGVKDAVPQGERREHETQGTQLPPMLPIITDRESRTARYGNQRLRISSGVVFDVLVKLNQSVGQFVKSLQLLKVIDKDAISDSVEADYQESPGEVRDAINEIRAGINGAGGPNDAIVNRRANKKSKVTSAYQLRKPDEDPTSGRQLPGDSGLG